MPPPEVLERLQGQHCGVVSTVSEAGTPQAAIVVSGGLEVFFDTLGDSRKAANLRRNAHAAFTIGPSDAGAAWTIQLEGPAGEPSGGELARLLDLYLTRFPDGRERQSLPGITYFRVTTTWLRYSDFRQDPPAILEFRLA
jgi:hypothetical protein